MDADVFADLRCQATSADGLGCIRSVKDGDPERFEYCSDHGCRYAHCAQGREEGSKGYCRQHCCVAGPHNSCDRARLVEEGSLFCEAHTCEAQTCRAEVAGRGERGDASRSCPRHRRCGREGCAERCHRRDTGSTARWCGLHYCHEPSCQGGRAPGSSQHCSEHTCLEPMCGNGKHDMGSGRYCLDHQCRTEGCLERRDQRTPGAHHCALHACRAEHCPRPATAGTSTCDDHRCCREQGCREYVLVEKGPQGDIRHPTCDHREPPTRPETGRDRHSRLTQAGAGNAQTTRHSAPPPAWAPAAAAPTVSKTTRPTAATTRASWPAAPTSAASPPCSTATPTSAPSRPANSCAGTPSPAWTRPTPPCAPACCSVEAPPSSCPPTAPPTPAPPPPAVVTVSPSWAPAPSAPATSAATGGAPTRPCATRRAGPPPAATATVTIGGGGLPPVAEPYRRVPLRPCPCPRECLSGIPLSSGPRAAIVVVPTANPIPAPGRGACLSGACRSKDQGHLKFWVCLVEASTCVWFHQYLGARRFGGRSI